MRFFFTIAMILWAVAASAEGPTADQLMDAKLRNGQALSAEYMEQGLGQFAGTYERIGDVVRDTPTEENSRPINEWKTPEKMFCEEEIVPDESRIWVCTFMLPYRSGASLDALNSAEFSENRTVYALRENENGFDIDRHWTRIKNQ